ncbi:hypothetical protein [Haloprofundus halobius]|uniref:hypothetical protein n=1 Tax=Haloprofundus halobius TaxID=2876194 RepID=UPI001CCC8A80|nr:hypothetical protein [Haloprofundus halobius]
MDADDREVSIKCSKIILRGGTGHKLRTYNIGSPDEEPKFVDGAYLPEDADGETYRWFGKQTTIRFPKYTSDDFGLYGGIDAKFEPASTPLKIGVCTYRSYFEPITKSGWQTEFFDFHGW